jgi:hypothetical protein
VTRLFMVCVETTGDPYFGLSVARYIHASNIHALGYALMASRTLWEFLSPAGAVLRDRFQAAVLRGKGAGPAILHFNRRTNLCGETEDAFLAFMFRFMRLLLGKPLAPGQVCLMRACPAGGRNPTGSILSLAGIRARKAWSNSMPRSSMNCWQALARPRPVQ